MEGQEFPFLPPSSVPSVKSVVEFSPPSFGSALAIASRAMESSLTLRVGVTGYAAPLRGAASKIAINNSTQPTHATTTAAAFQLDTEYNVRPSSPVMSVAK